MQRFGWHLPASQPWRLYGDGLYGRELCFNGIGGTEMNAWLVFAIMCAGVAAVGIWAALRKQN